MLSHRPIRLAVAALLLPIGAGIAAADEPKVKEERDIMYTKAAAGRGAEARRRDAGSGRRPIPRRPGGSHGGAQLRRAMKADVNRVLHEFAG